METSKTNESNKMNQVDLNSSVAPSGKSSRVHKFIEYFSGDPLSKIQYSYDSTRMYEAIDGVVTSINITEDELSHLNSLHADEVILASHIFCGVFR